MAPSHSRQLLAWSLPTLAVLLSYLWYKKRRIGARSDPGDTEVVDSVAVPAKTEPRDIEETEHSPVSSPNRSFSRSLSGVDSAPIDIILPPERRSKAVIAVSDEDEFLDQEIEKLKRMKNASAFSTPKKQSPVKSKSPPIPEKEEKEVLSNNNSNKKSKKRNIKKMAQKDLQVAETKLTALKLNTSKGDREEIQRQSSERDSANHSPADVMLSSPPLSNISDNHSEGSSDSGKGGSDVATPPPSRTPLDVSGIQIYQFLIPQNLVGKLIGKQGAFVAQIKDRANAQVLIKKHPSNGKLKICCVEGTKPEIDKALKMIRNRFPIKRFSDLTLEQVNFVDQCTVSLISDHLYLKLIECINNDTILSCMVAPNHLFLQQPTHPSFPSLNMLTSCMNCCYADSNSPMLPKPIPDNTICAAFSVDSWYRAMVLSTDAESDTSYVKFLDYGGYAYVENDKLRQIRGDFMLLPFQAAECVLANVRPLSEDGSWPVEAYDLIAEVTKGVIIYTQVSDFTEEGIPLVFCYIVSNAQEVVFLNQLLVDHGYAEWISAEVAAEALPAEGAVGGVTA